MIPICIFFLVHLSKTLIFLNCFTAYYVSDGVRWGEGVSCARFLIISVEVE